MNLKEAIKILDEARTFNEMKIAAMPTFLTGAALDEATKLQSEINSCTLAMDILKQQAQQPEGISLLRDLADLQNGPPLERHRKEWEETMSQVYDFLNKWEPKTLD